MELQVGFAYHHQLGMNPALSHLYFINLNTQIT